MAEGTLALALWNWSSLFSSSLRRDCFSCSSSVTRFCSFRVSEVSIPRVTSCEIKIRTLNIQTKTIRMKRLTYRNSGIIIFSILNMRYSCNALLRRHGKLLHFRRTLSCRCTLTRCCCGWSLFSCGRVWRRSADTRRDNFLLLKKK